MSATFELVYCFFLMIIFVVLFNVVIIKPLLISRLKSNPPPDYNSWFIVNNEANSLKIKQELSHFVRETYQTRQSGKVTACRAYLHVFAHTTAGKPLAVLFDSRDDSVMQTRYLNHYIDPVRWLYHPRINGRCIDSIDRWRDYFIDNHESENNGNTPPFAEKNNDVPRHAIMQQWLSHLDRELITTRPAPSPFLSDYPQAMLASRYRYTLLYLIRTTEEGKPRRVIIVQFTDTVTSRSWNFELTEISWNPLRGYADLPESDSATKHSDDNDISIANTETLSRLQRLMPVSWLTRPDKEKDAHGINQPQEKTADIQTDPCWRQAHGRAVIGKRAVTLQDFYYHYLRGLQLPSTDEEKSASIKNTLQRLYFDCQYDRGSAHAITRTGNKPSSLITEKALTAFIPHKKTPSEKATINDSAFPTAADKQGIIDAVLYRVIPFLRICPPGRYFDELRQVCK